MNVYHNLASSPPTPVPSGEQPARTAHAVTAPEEGKWEGMAVAGAATLARNFSSASQRFAAVERSKSTNGGHRGGSGGGFQAAVRRAFSMRRQPGSGISDGYWRIHDGMDEDADGADEAELQQQVLEEADKHQKKEEKGEATEQVAEGDAASNNKETEIKGRKNKKKGRILKACKKLLGF